MLQIRCMYKLVLLVQQMRNYLSSFRCRFENRWQSHLYKAAVRKSGYNAFKVIEHFAGQSVI